MKKFAALCTVMVTILTVIFPHICTEYAKNAVDMCINVLIPSLFPFLVCANLMISLGIADTAAHFSEKIMKPLFRINGGGAFPLIMGLLSGYPMGAVLCCNLYSREKLSKNEACRLMMFTNNSGPLFIISAVGIGVFGSLKAGIILYVSHVFSALTIGVFSRIFYSSVITGQSSNVKIPKSSASNAVSDSIMSILTLCGYVIFFSVILGLASHMKVTDNLAAIFSLFGLSKNDSTLFSKGLFEITSAIFTSPGSSMPAVSALISLGGISVLFQVMSFCRKSALPIKPYIIGKILCGGFSALYTNIILKYFSCETPVFSDTLCKKVDFYTPYLMIFLLLCCVFFIIFVIFLCLPRGGKSVYPEKQSLPHTRS